MKENKYFFYRDDQRQEFFEFFPSDKECLEKAGYKYFGRVLNLLEPQIKNKGLIIYVTAWTVHNLPNYGPNVISFILQDEWGREPHYRHKVGMIFKTCGKKPYNLHSYKYGNLYDKISNFLAESRAFYKGGKGRLRSIYYRLQNKKLAPVYDLPLGYYALEDLPYLPIENRTNDLYFGGSVQHISYNKKFVKRPKELARERMTNALDAMSYSNPNISVVSATTNSFEESIITNNKGYLENMMNAKVALIPRGANLETFRFYEALKCGCIPVGEAFPNQWFYKDAPIVRLRNWNDLCTIIPPLLKDTDRLQELHKKVLDWWNKKCSEKATAEYILSKIK